MGEFFLTYGEPQLNYCIWQAILCKVWVLKVYIHCPDYSLGLDDLPFVSQHLTRLELHNSALTNSSLDFSSCPVLERLELNGCDYSRFGLLKPAKIVSESVKHLRIFCCFNNDILTHHSRFHIHTPNLVSLHLDDMMLLPPMLQNMPSLVDAFIRLARSTTCKCYSCQLSDSSYNADNNDTNSVLLNGLSQAKSLTLISTDYSLIVFKGDLRWCPIFSNLKTLLLNEHWCVPDVFDELACILEHSPVLEKLTLQLFLRGLSITWK